MNVNRLFCIGRNYAKHVAERARDADEGDFVVFMKPASSVVAEDEPVELPRDRGEIHHEAELVVLLTGGGRDIPEEEALEQVAGLSLGLDLTARDLQSRLQRQGLPWELSKSFDGAAPLGDFKPYLEQNLQALEFSCHVNGELRQHGYTGDMIFSVARQIHLLSKSWALQPGDALFTGTPEGVGPVRPGDRITLSSPGIGRFQWSFA